ncbi:MAG: hypothetical protein JSW66_05030 [Phycisphaerales bacterium]|nr:MAG: hypothetical protein JSW66_05030 [Phycisphaerales bacterium]
MSTQAQVKANRENAQKSTEPNTAEGKAGVAQSPFKRGIFAVQEVISVEDQADFDLLREQMIAELAAVEAGSQSPSLGLLTEDGSRPVSDSRPPPSSGRKTDIPPSLLKL